MKPGELITYEILDSLGADSVRIDKLDHGNYSIDFATIGRYELFAKEYL